MADTSKRGFASMDAAKQREIASKGGKAAHAKGTAHEFTPEEAREAGRKGGEAVSRDRAHMAEIGRAGGKNSHKSRKKKSAEESQSSNGDAPEAKTESQESSEQPTKTTRGSRKAK